MVDCPVPLCEKVSQSNMRQHFLTGTTKLSLSMATLDHNEKYECTSTREHGAKHQDGVLPPRYETATRAMVAEAMLPAPRFMSTLMSAKAP
jgi:hypothetical protein